MTEKVRILITVDTEFSIGGAFDDPSNKKPVGTRAVELPAGQSSQGLGFLLETLQRSSLRATFFVETCNAAFFGPDPISQIIRTIDTAGHDIQLHLHPCWSAFDNTQWHENIKEAVPNDSLADYPVAEIMEFIQNGVQLIENNGVSSPVAMRAGNLHAGKSVYEAMDRSGIQIGSNVGLAVNFPTEPALQRYGGCISIANSLELPVLSYREVNFGKYYRNKTLTIIGSTIAELKYLLTRAHQIGLRNIVILTHPSEFANYVQPSITNITPNKRTQARFEQLCMYLSQNDDLFEVTTFADTVSSGLKPCDDPILSVPLRFTARRLLERVTTR